MLWFSEIKTFRPKIFFSKAHQFAGVPLLRLMALHRTVEADHTDSFSHKQLSAFFVWNAMSNIGQRFILLN